MGGNWEVAGCPEKDIKGRMHIWRAHSYWDLNPKKIKSFLYQDSYYLEEGAWKASAFSLLYIQKYMDLEQS